MAVSDREAPSLHIEVDPTLQPPGHRPPGEPSGGRRRGALIAVAALLAVLIALAMLLLTGIVGGSEPPDTAPGPSAQQQVDAALDGVSRPFGRLRDALDAARPQRRTSMLQLSVAAASAGDALDDAAGQLRSAAQTSPAEDRAALSTTETALEDLGSLTDALAATRLSLDEIETATIQARRALADADLPLPRLRTADLVSAVRRSRSPEPAAADDSGSSVPVGAAASSAPSTAPSYFAYSGPAFLAQLPRGSGWGSPVQTEPTPGELFRTSVRGPSGLFVIVDYTPLEPASFGSGYTSAETVGQTAFGTGTRYVFTGGSIPECQRSTCFDYILNDSTSGSGFAVLAGGGDRASAEALARTVAESVLPIGD